jgi:hypothetical protein
LSVGNRIPVIYNTPIVRKAQSERSMLSNTLRKINPNQTTEAALTHRQLLVFLTMPLA